MRKPILVTGYGKKVRKEASSLIIVSESAKTKIPLGIISHLILLPGVEISASAVRFLTKHKRPVIFVNNQLQVQAFVNPWELKSETLNLKMCQFKVFESEKNLLIRELLRRKLVVIKRYFFLREEKFHSLSEKIEVAETLNDFLTIDGEMGRIMYDEIRREIPPPFKFTKRSYHPPEDEVNSVLSFSFSIFTLNILCAILAKGYEPFKGFFHCRRGTHATLASDIIELSRPPIIKLVGKMFSKGLFKEKDFYKTNAGIRIDKKAIRGILEILLEEDIREEIESFSLQFLNWLTLIVRRKCSM
ncbi:CRISP-associated protein Cas1 [Desulfurobacterium pacificum]|uniref:CRISPR-associated endonuclease Cas1 n=1 Tax=Desulfurobacterium pacificum TaxID=240166 RepID=A0ABY1N7L3_9BACT|nr:CRISPR-associated endonuclease Cas1 [Desulfurobacterium pacificum]SMP02533.1 CRISP-associated protein Cas1 [Desulfurobacterium pacificum]